MKVAEQRHDDLDKRTLKTWLHIKCDCGEFFAHNPSKGDVCVCPKCERTEIVKGADVPRFAPLVPDKIGESAEGGPVRPLDVPPDPQTAAAR